jgi:hypothetical protein
MEGQINRNDPTLNVDRSICEQIVASALACGYRISVHDEESEVLNKSSDPAEIVENMFGTDMDTLVFFNGQNRIVGSMVLVYGNDPGDVISDYSATASMEALYASVAAHFPGILAI